MFVLCELLIGRDNDTIRRYGVQSFPSFAVVDSKGALRVPPGAMLSNVIRGRGPADAVQILMSFHYRSCVENKELPPSADVVRAHLRFLESTNEPAKADAWLEQNLANAKLAPEETACLKAEKALQMRRSGDKAGGLALLRELAPDLTLAEATREGLLEPFSLAKGDVSFGTVSSDTDARLLSSALAWLGTLQGDIPAPAGLEAPTLVTGAASLAAVLNRPADAEAWVRAYKAAAGENAFKGAPAAILADGLSLIAAGKVQEGARRLMVLVEFAPEKSYAPWAGTLAVEALRKAGETSAADENRKLIEETYGNRLPAELGRRLA
jgi:Arc/MetJ-type ribon-helix-helix transcriptional regulator